MAVTYDGLVASIIDNILIINPQVDVKIGTAIRDLFINVQAQQLETIYGYLQTAANAQSVLTAIDTQLDRIAYNYNLTRNPATRSTTNLTIEIQSGIVAPTVCNVGDQFSTLSDQNGNIQIFINTLLTLLTPGQTVAILPLVALNPGISGNVPAYSITQSNYNFATSVFNAIAATGGNDTENDISFAARIPLSVTGQYTNTQKGVINTLLKVSNIVGTPYIATPDSPQSRGQYTVDVYLKRNSSYFGTVVLESAPANVQQYTFLQQPLYELQPLNQVTVYNPVTNTTQTIPPIINGVVQYQVIPNPIDTPSFYSGTVKSGQILNWLVPPPTLPYQISYNVDNTIVNAQTLFDDTNEITDDLLFKQSLAIPLYIAATITLQNGANQTSAYNNADTNLTNLFDGISVTEQLTLKELDFSFLQDTNVVDVNVTNFDTTFNIQITPPASTQQVKPSNQSLITPFGFFWETDVTSPVLYYKIASRLWIGNPDIINAANFNNSTGFNFNTPTTKQGIIDQNIISGYSTNWATEILPYYDSVNQVLVLNFTTAAPPVSGVVTLNVVQQNVDTLSNISYLTLAPSLVSPAEPYQIPANLGLTSQQYATTIPSGLNLSQSILYKNGVPLTIGNNISLNDYQIVSGPDPTTGLINISLTNNPSTTDIFQFGILNPNLTFANSTSQFTS